MANVMYDKRIEFEGNTYLVSQTWNEQEILISCIPDNPKLRAFIEMVVRRDTQLHLREEGGVWTIAN